MIFEGWERVKVDIPLKIRDNAGNIVETYVVTVDADRNPVDGEMFLTPEAQNTLDATRARRMRRVSA